VSHGSFARSVTSVTARVNELSHEPVPPIASGLRDSASWAACLAFSALSPASATTSLNLAPPSDLTPPALLMSSIAMSAPSFISWPWRAQGPDIGAIKMILTSFISATAWPAASVSGAATTAASAASDARRESFCTFSYFDIAVTSFGLSVVLVGLVVVLKISSSLSSRWSSSPASRRSPRPPARPAYMSTAYKPR